MTTRRAEDHPTAPPDALGQGLVGSGITGMQGQDDVGRRGRSEIDDRADLEADAIPAQRAALLGLLPHEFLVDVNSDQACRYIENVIEVVICGKGQMRAAASAVHDQEGIVVHLLQLPGLDHPPEELVNLPELLLHMSPDLALFGHHTDDLQERVWAICR